MPSPWAAAVAVMGMLTLGVLLGSAGSQIAQSAGLTSIVLEVPTPAPAAEEPTEAPAAEATAAPEPAPVLPATTSSIPIAAPAAEEPLPEAAPEPTPPPEFFEEEETLPPVKHVFMIVLGENSYEEAFGASSPAPYLAQTLAAKGELLDQLLRGDQGRSGQPDRPAQRPGADRRNRGRAARCTTDIVPGHDLRRRARSKGPAASTRGDRDAARPAGRKETEMEGLRRGPRHPLRPRGRLARSPRLLPLADRRPRMRRRRRQPRTARARPENREEDAGALLHRPQRLPRRRRTAVRDQASPPGHSPPKSSCEQVVPEIEASPAYKEGGLIAITSAAGAPDRPDARTPAPAASPRSTRTSRPKRHRGSRHRPGQTDGGGGRVGLLLLSPFVAPGTVNETRLLQPLLAAEQHRGTVRTGTARLRRPKSR